MTEAIDDGDALLRRVRNKPDRWKRQDDGTVRPTSVAFKPHSVDAGVSVDVRRLLIDPADPVAVQETTTGDGLAELPAAAARDLDLDVVHDPLPDNAAHANIVGLGAFTKSEAKLRQRSLADRCVWVRMPATAL